MKLNKPKIKVGIISEHPNNDAKSLIHLLQNVICEDIEFKILQKNRRGSDLDAAGFLADLKAEFRSEMPHYIVLVRDLDGLMSQQKLVQEKENWFNKANTIIENRGIFFLVIYEMEALILSDIQGFNKYYGITKKFEGNPLFKEKPKEHLKSLSSNAQKGQYDVNHAPDIFKSLSIKTVFEKHKSEKHSFHTFALNLLDKQILDKEKFKILNIKLPPQYL